MHAQKRFFSDVGLSQKNISVEENNKENRYSITSFGHPHKSSKTKKVEIVSVHDYIHSHTMSAEFQPSANIIKKTPHIDHQEHHHSHHTDHEHNHHHIHHSHIHKDSMKTRIVRKSSQQLHQSKTGVFWNKNTEQEISNLSKHDLLLIRNLLRQNVKYDWRQYPGRYFDMQCLYFPSVSEYKYQVRILNCSSQHIRLQCKFTSTIFKIKFSDKYFARGISKIIQLQSISNKKIRRAHLNTETSTNLYVSGVNRKNEILWKVRIPIYYQTKTSQLDFSLQQKNVLPKFLTPLTF